ncbi:hypothetical protein PV327_007441 [Microctonus hyperodae]|uniref:SWIM-type domain-containing protein n=1 Tax=Microctonus hyperodae TaxID=165561 RepID=A0AA39FZF4_MICHY|nr:hypothetical protein PV327_007441 [Microctonus hyperodae]
MKTENQKNIYDAERILLAGHLFKCGISKNGKIISTLCSCKAGLGEKCNNVVATLFYCYRKDELEILLCTDQNYKWKTMQSDAIKQYEPASIIDHLCFSKFKRKIFSDSNTNDSETDEHDISINKESNSLRKRKRHNHSGYLFKDRTTEKQEQMDINIKEQLVKAAMIKHK